MMKTPPSASLRVKRKNVRQMRKHFCLSRANSQDSESSLWKIQSGQRDPYFTKMPATVIQRQEMASYLRLFDDDLIQDFLRMDCCYKMTDKVMAIVPSHFVWQRQRSDHHSGALRQYNTQGPTRFPRGPSASPVSCALCNCGSRLHRISSSQPSAQTTSYLNPFAPAFTFELTPPKASNRASEEDKDEAPKLCCFCPEKLPRETSSCDSSCDPFIDWISEM